MRRPLLLLLTAVLGPGLLGGGCGLKDFTSGESPSPWTAKSQGLEVTCGGFFEGVTRFRATRAQLSPKQLQLLADLTLVTPKTGCPSDSLACTVAITQEKGGVVKRSAISGDPACNNVTEQVIAFASFEPFRKTIGCRYSKAGLGAAEAPLGPEPLCLHGMFAGAIAGGIAPITLPLRVDAPGPRHLELDECDSMNRQGKLTATVRLPPGTDALATLAAVAAPAAGPDHACASADYTFAQAGTYELHIAFDPGFLPAGDFFLKYY